MEGALTQKEIFERLLILLWDALFAKQAYEWTERGVANLLVADARDLGYWFLRGQKVGEKPIFD
eukprot:6079887-Karenia_brevis.AAC.1